MLQAPFWLEHWPCVPPNTSGATSSASWVAPKASEASGASAVSTAQQQLLVLPPEVGYLPCLMQDLLPENVFEAFIPAGDKDKDKKEKVPKETFQDWALAYTTWASAIIAASLSRGLELLQYLAFIGHFAWDNPYMFGCIMTSSLDNGSRRPSEYQVG